ncbi:ComF family protein [Paenibacillus albidus]|uniref:ComF family protein n=1 Tax=Paenibacillus albidus TaxID=2041023 RepID=UPI001BE93562|nr:ComF family protein [Paenibacillus albidus]MBT2291635.1 ComF family protein [Paenibacillus albidus]
MNIKLLAWLKGAQSLLAPSDPICLSCGKRARLSTRLPAICTACAAAIPWITRPRCRKCGRATGCPDCSRSGEPSPIVCNRSAVAYTADMRDWLGKYKYRGNERYAPLLGTMLDRAYDMLAAEMEQAMQETLLPACPGPARTGCPIAVRWLNPRPVSTAASRWEADLFIPVPVSNARLEERGFNQAERLADMLSRRRGIPQLPLLIRTHHTAKQSFKSRAERLADMKFVFAANPDPAIRPMLRTAVNAPGPLERPLRIIIVDDIYTTGSTIRACALVVERLAAEMGYGAEIYSLTWARS